VDTGESARLHSVSCLPATRDKPAFGFCETGSALPGQDSARKAGAINTHSGFAASIERRTRLLERDILRWLFKVSGPPR
jgi:hypothetical protein